MTGIYFTDCSTPIPDNNWLSVLSTVPFGLQERILRFKFREDQQASLVGKLLLKKVLENLSSEFTLHDLSYTPENKPYISDNLSFSISHSNDYVMCAFSDESEIGIDIEKKRVLKYEEFGRVFTDEEFQDILQSSNIQNSFFDYWTKKEALIKADGRGMKLSLKEAKVDGNSGKIHHTDWHLQEIKIHEEYACHIALERKSNIFIENVSLKSMLVL